MELKPALCTSVFSLVLILCILLSEHRAASQAVVGGMVMSKPVSNSCCCFGAAAQSKSLSVGHLEQKQAQIEAEATAFTAQQCSPWLRGGKAFNYSHEILPLCYHILPPLPAVCRSTGNTALEYQH